MYTLSINYWISDESPDEFTSKIIPLDAKYIGAGGLFQHMMNEKKLWQDFGDLVVPVRRLKDKEKERYKETVAGEFKAQCGASQLAAGLFLQQRCSLPYGEVPGEVAREEDKLKSSLS